MDHTIRNLDEAAFRRLKARAALAGKTIGQTVNEAMHAYLARPDPGRPRESLRRLKPEDYPPGNERLSEEIDSILYTGDPPPA